VLLRPGTMDESIWTSVLVEYPTLPERFETGDIVLDIGCHTGAFCRVAAERGATVIGYEASRENHALASINLAGQASVTVKNEAVGRSDVGASVLLFTPSPERSNTGGGSVLFETEDAHATADLPWHRPDASETQPLNAHEVPVVRLDDILTELGRVRFLKIDVEGAEYPILLTAGRLDLVDAIGGEYHELGSAELKRVAPALRAGLEDWSTEALRRALETAGFDVTFEEPQESHGIFYANRPAGSRR
jgi:FkbM family methyltransferase